MTVAKILRAVSAVSGCGVRQNQFHRRDRGEEALISLAITYVLLYLLLVNDSLLHWLYTRLRTALKLTFQHGDDFDSTHLVGWNRRLVMIEM